MKWQIKKFFGRDKREEKVLRRYGELAGSILNGEMVNKDKESRARQWVKEQEKIEIEFNKKIKWWEKDCVQIIMFLGAIAGIIGLILLFI